MEFRKNPSVHVNDTSRSRNSASFSNNLSSPKLKNDRTASKENSLSPVLSSGKVSKKSQKLSSKRSKIKLSNKFQLSNISECYETVIPEESDDSVDCENDQVRGVRKLEDDVDGIRFCTPDDIFEDYRQIPCSPKLEHNYSQQPTEKQSKFIRKMHPPVHQVLSGSVLCGDGSFNCSSSSQSKKSLFSQLNNESMTDSQMLVIADNCATLDKFNTQWMSSQNQHCSQNFETHNSPHYHENAPHYRQINQPERAGILCIRCQNKATTSNCCLTQNCLGSDTGNGYHISQSKRVSERGISCQINNKTPVRVLYHGPEIKSSITCNIKGESDTDNLRPTKTSGTRFKNFCGFTLESDESFTGFDTVAIDLAHKKFEACKNVVHSLEKTLPKMDKPTLSRSIKASQKSIFSVTEPFKEVLPKQHTIEENGNSKKENKCKGCSNCNCARDITGHSHNSKMIGINTKKEMSVSLQNQQVDPKIAEMKNKPNKIFVPIEGQTDNCGFSTTSDKSIKEAQRFVQQMCEEWGNNDLVACSKVESPEKASVKHKKHKSKASTNSLIAQNQSKNIASGSLTNSKVEDRLTTNKLSIEIGNKIRIGINCERFKHKVGSPTSPKMYNIDEIDLARGELKKKIPSNKSPLTAQPDQYALVNPENVPNTIQATDSNQIKNNFKDKEYLQTLYKSDTFKTASGKDIKISDEKLQKVTNLFNEEGAFSLVNKPQPSMGANSFTVGFCSAGGKTIKIGVEAMKRAQNLFKDDHPMDEEISGNISHNFSTEKEEMPSSTGDADVSLDNQKRACDIIRELIDTVDDKIESLDRTSSRVCDTPMKSLQGKKRLGVSACKQMTIPENSTEKARALFADFDLSFQGESIAVSPLLKKNCSNRSSTPVKSFFNNDSFMPPPNVTPIKPVKCSLNFSNFVQDRFIENSFVIKQPTVGTINDWESEINAECNRLQENLQKLHQRKEALHMQTGLINSADIERKRPRSGTLYLLKQKKNRIPLNKFVGDCKQTTSSLYSIPQVILGITPKNAELFHFNCQFDSGSIITTTDQAVIVPNCENMVGLSEIDTSFRTMPGVNHRLIPNDWIRNQFKWIIWKLASLERSFPHKFKGCLNIENIIQQLKYRYDCEIDRVQRSAIRKILEKDDIPQKRLVLCVADILKGSGNKLVLELTDGWYSILTTIDAPLSHQITKGKIVVGTKLIIQNAELLNCEGCHPLEPNSARLQISYNSCRRAVWHAKLGYQKFVDPFPILLNTVHVEGGLISHIKVLVARVYPVRYMERNGTLITWRNAKAEEKTIHEWESGRLDQIEKLYSKVQRDYENEEQIRRRDQVNTLKLKSFNINQITCPETLYSLFESSNDPEALQEMLSHSQMQNLVEYQQHVVATQQNKISAILSEKLKKLKLSKRDVISVLKLTVVDILGTSDKGTTFTIWKPTEEHLEILKEGGIFSIYNVIPRRNGDLASTGKTHFKNDSTPFPRHKKFERAFIPISVTLQLGVKPFSNEFDTVGLVVKVSIGNLNQDVWLTDALGRLLFIKILEGPKHCCLLSGLERGHSVAICNLVLCETQNSFGQAIANHYTTISRYPHKKRSQEMLQKFIDVLPKNTSKLFKNCDEQIATNIIKLDLGKMFTYQSTSLLGSASFSMNELFDDSFEDNASIPMGLTSTDIAMSMIDIGE